MPATTLPAYQGAIGVFAGCSMNTYFLNNICRDRKAIEDFTGTFQVGDYPVRLAPGGTGAGRMKNEAFF
jgi:acyl transferase domain-containing protein